MDVRWTEPAVRDLENIARYIRQDNPQAALRVMRALYDSAMSLESFPNRGRVGRIPGSRELAVAPYIVVYRVRGLAVQILRVYHRAQQRR